MVRDMLRRLSGARNGAPDSLTVGSPTPDLILPDGSGELVSLSNYRGRPVILVFYPADFSPVCGDQLVLYNEILPLFEAHNAQILGISVDNVWSHQAFADQRGIDFPILSDFQPKGAVARRYGVYDEARGVAQRALFLIDREGIIRWRHVSPPNVNPGADGILNALEDLPGS